MISTAVALAVVALPAAGGQTTAAIAACDALRAEGAGMEASSRCLAEAGSTAVARPLVAARLETLRRAHPGDPWPTYYLARIEWDRDTRAAADLYTVAGREFAAIGNVERAVVALLNAVRLRSNLEQLDEAMALIEEATALVESSDGDEPRRNAELAALIRVDRAHVLHRGGRDLLSAYRLLLEVEDEVTAIDEIEANNWLDTMANVTYDLGMRERSMVYRRRLIAGLERTGDRWSEAQAKYGLAIAHRAVYESREGVESQYEAFLEDALRAAEAGGNATIEWLAHLELGKLRGGESGREHLDRCLLIAGSMGDRRGTILCSRGLAGVVRHRDPEAARRLLAASIEMANEAGDVQAGIYGSAERLLIGWQTLPRERAIEDAFRTLDLIDSYRALQASERGRAGVFSVWATIYQRVVGLLLEDAERGDRRAVGRAFAVSERMRARSLLDALDRHPSTPPATADPELAEALRRIVALQRQLLDPALDEAGRRALTDELHRAETLELQLRGRATGRPRGAEVQPRAATRPDGAGGFATLDEVRARLTDREAMLVFQVALRDNVYGNFAGDSWVLAVTRETVSAHRLPDRRRLEPVVPTFTDLVGQRTEAYRSRAPALYRMLVADALAGLPDTVDRLVIVPDGVLHQLPFAVLAESAHAPPLADRYEIGIVPSATLWLRWREAGREEAHSPALVFANPTLGADARSSFAAQVGGGSGAGTRLGSLPYASEEGRAIARRLGRGTHVLAELDATERTLKAATLSDYRLIHFAAHAVIDEAVPERSAIYLAPGAMSEDGLLQSREILSLPLAGKVIVLSGCQSAAGAVLRGEGVLSLARSFFQAGATTIIGSLWPLRDDDAAYFFDAFYGHLAGGVSVGEALRAAQADRRAAGAPAAGWAGMVVLGDASAVPFPGGRPARWPLRVGVALLGVLAAALAWRVYRRRVRDGGPRLRLRGR